MSTPIITLLTDFGSRDYFAGSVKGVILSINPQAVIVDLSHEIRPYNIEEAAFLLKSAYRYFPRNTIHLAVVDPGVGSERRPILVAGSRYYFLAPDNGILNYIYEEDAPVRVFHITAEHYFLKSAGTTFHGRDVFAPVAAWLSKGVDVTRFGTLIEDYLKRPIPRPESVGSGSIKGAVIYIDRFGNLITSITRPDLEPWLSADKPLAVTIKGKTIQGLKQFYAQAASGELSAVINSNGHLEIFCYQSSAQSLLNAANNEPVVVK